MGRTSSSSLCSSAQVIFVDSKKGSCQNTKFSILFPYHCPPPPKKKLHFPSFDTRDKLYKKTKTKDDQKGNLVPLSGAKRSVCIQYVNCSSFLFVIRYFPAAQAGCDLLPSSDRWPLHSCRAALGSTEVAIQQRGRVPGRRHGDQPQVARADICHRRADAFPVHAIASRGEICQGDPFALSF